MSEPTETRPVIRITLVPGRNGGDAGGGTTQAVVMPPAPPAPAAVAPVPKPVVKLARKAPPRGTAVKESPAAKPAKIQRDTSRSVVPAVPGPTSGSGGAMASLGSAGGGNGKGTGGGGDGSGFGGPQFATYLALVREAIDRAKRYPPMARRREIEGRVSMLIEIASGGQARVVELRHSDHPLLGEAARHAVEVASPFPPFPAEIEAATLRIEIPVRFALNAR